LSLFVILFISPLNSFFPFSFALLVYNNANINNILFWAFDAKATIRA
jgi:hypothetical protein